MIDIEILCLRRKTIVVLQVIYGRHRKVIKDVVREIVCFLLVLIRLLANESENIADS